MTSALILKAEIWTQSHIEGIKSINKEYKEIQKKVAIYKPRRKVWNRLTPRGPQKEPTMPTS